jgi:hypothetical protein
MKQLLHEDLHVPGPDWTQGPFTTVGEITPDRPRTLFDMMRDKDTSYPNNTRVPQPNPVPGQNLLELLANFNASLNDLRNVVKNSGENPVVAKNDKLKQEAGEMLKRFAAIESKVREIEQILQQYTIAPVDEEEQKK